MSEIVLLRHGQSLWNQQNMFTGWTDVDLTSTGQDEARWAGHILKSHGYQFDFCFTSYLKRAIKTAWIVLEEMELMWIPVEKSWRLNERHYGALQGEDKTATARQYGQEQVFLWRRSYDVAPPGLDPSDPRAPCHDQKYARIDPSKLPLTESLQMTVERVIPYWHTHIVPLLRKQEAVCICAHGNSLRGLVKYLEEMSDEDITTFEIPTGVPLVYTLTEELTVKDKLFLKETK